MICLVALTGTGMTGCMNTASLPASPTVQTQRTSQSVPTSQVVQSAGVGSAAHDVASQTQPQTSSTANVTFASRSSNPWKPKVNERKWKYIVLHHTASEAGSVSSIDAAHKQRRDSAGKPWLGIGYHFVIGNGNGMKDGEIQPSFRWTKQLHGAHAGVADYNDVGIGIVLVGNFEKKRPTAAQLRSARRLVQTLRSSYRITSKNIVTHGDVNKTACPGKYFSLARITGLDEEATLGAASSASGQPLTFADRREVQ